MVFVLFAVADASQARIDPAEERSQAAEIVLLPFLEGMVVALGAIDPHTEKRPGHPRRQPFRGRHLEVGVVGHGNEVGRRLVGPEPAIGDQVPNQAVITPVFQQHVAEPRDEPSSPVDDEGAVFGADINPGEPLGQVIGAPPVGKQGIEPFAGLAPLSARPRTAGFPRAKAPCRRAPATAAASKSSRQPKLTAISLRRGPLLVEQVVDGFHR